MIRALFLAGTFLLALVPPSAPARAHHSFAMFDLSKVITLTGTIKELQWAAPHVLIWFVEDPKEREGDHELSTSPGPLTRLGWTKRSLVPGDRVTVEISPLHSGEPGGAFKKLTILATGQVLTSAAPGGNAGTGSEPSSSVPAAAGR
jgi:Family of unknown function (DUF6152)